MDPRSGINGVLLLNPHGSSLYWNDAVREHLCVDPHFFLLEDLALRVDLFEADGRTPVNAREHPLYHTLHSGQTSSRILCTAKKGKTPGPALMIQTYSIQDPTGWRNCLLLLSRPCTDEDFTGMDLDVAAHRHRLMLAGQLSECFFHDLSQPASAIQLYSRGCQTLMENPSDKDELDVHEVLDSLHEQSNRLNRQIQDIKNFITRAPTKTSDCDLNEVFQRAVNMIQTDLRHEDLQIQCDFCSDPLLVTIDAIQIQQVIIQLALLQAQGCGEMRPARIVFRSWKDNQACLSISREIETIEDSGTGKGPSSGLRSESVISLMNRLGICNSILAQYMTDLSVLGTAPDIMEFRFALPIRGSQENVHEA